MSEYARHLHRLDQLAQEFHLTGNELDRAHNRFAGLKSEFKLAEATEKLQATGTVPERDAKALLRARDVYRKMLLAEGQLEGLRSRFQSMKAESEGLRTLIASAREETKHPVAAESIR